MPLAYGTTRRRSVSRLHIDTLDTCVTELTSRRKAPTSPVPASLQRPPIAREPSKGSGRHWETGEAVERALGQRTLGLLAWTSTTPARCYSLAGDSCRTADTIHGWEAYSPSEGEQPAEKPHSMLQRQLDTIGEVQSSAHSRQSTLAS